MGAILGKDCSIAKGGAGTFTLCSSLTTPCSIVGRAAGISTVTNSGKDCSILGAGAGVSIGASFGKDCSITGVAAGAFSGSIFTDAG